MSPIYTIVLLTTYLAQCSAKTSQIHPKPNVITRIPNLCNTLSGAKCFFPFTYLGVEHYQCTYASSPTPWCATEVDANSTTITNKWGDCSTGSLSSCFVEDISLSSCVTVGGPHPQQNCIFPFRHLGVTYTSCTTLGQDHPWCSTNTTISGTHISGYYGVCPSSCLVAESSSVTTLTPTTTQPITPSGQNPTTPTQPTSRCITQSGPAAGHSCVFPFTYSGRTYNTCTQWIYGGDNEVKLWCSTKIDKFGLHIIGEGHYGFCTPQCGPVSIPLTGVNAREKNSEADSKDAVVFLEELPLILDYPK